MHSAIYRGWLDHRRREPRRHGFRYGLFMAYLDLAELDQVFRGRWLWSTRRRALVRFDRRDHLGDPVQPLDEAVRSLVEVRTGHRPTGPIRLLTHLRVLGYVFNPVSFFYCFDAGGRALEAVVAEVNNTPWGERHCYVLRPDAAALECLQAASEKAMHVSPFHPMDLRYEWQLQVPGDSLAVHMALRPAAGGRAIFGATLALERVPITGRALAATLLRFPWMSAKVIAAIHWEALRLFVKRTPIFDHPTRSRAARRAAAAALPPEPTP